MKAQKMAKMKINKAELNNGGWHRRRLALMAAGETMSARNDWRKYRRNERNRRNGESCYNISENHMKMKENLVALIQRSFAARRRRVLQRCIPPCHYTRSDLRRCHYCAYAICRACIPARGA